MISTGQSARRICWAHCHSLSALLSTLKTVQWFPASNMSNLFVLTLSALFLAHESTSGYLINVYPQLKQFPLADNEDAGAPLFLTPLIENGKIEEARTKALVQHKEMGDISSYSGYLTVNKEYNSNLFFWFFPAMVSN